MSEWDRTDPEYISCALDQVYGTDSAEVIFGLRAKYAPTTLTQLASLARCECSNDYCFEIIDNFLQLIATDPDPDDIVRKLPYDPVTGDLWFVLPAATSETNWHS